MVKVDVDFAWNETIQDVLRGIRKHGGKIVDFEPTGPGGGNPNILLGFDTESAALGFLAERYPDETEEFNASRLRRAEASVR
ncbi:hypothetical protein [Nitrobacter sp. TKz-YC02]|uniref:hypothetical protein n=1 Tax=Nitrobacter sp. TKz-YC02 TaxID=3398704 RepID=UPI003CF3DEA4